MMKRNQICGITDLRIFSARTDGSINWTALADGHYEFSGIHGQLLQLLLDFLGVNVLQMIDYYKVKITKDVIPHIIFGEFRLFPDQIRKRLATTPYEMTSLSFVVRKYVPLSTRFAFLYPFSIQIWIGFLFISFILPIIGILLISRKSSYLDLCLKLMSCFFKQSIQMPTKSLKIRIFLLPWLLFTMVVSMSYSAVFFSFMVNPLKNPPLKNFQDLSASLTAGKHKCYVYSSDYARKAFQDSNISYIQRMGKLNGDNVMYITRLNSSYALQDNIIYVKDFLNLNLEFGRNADLFISDDRIEHILIVRYLIMNNHCLRNKVNSFISRVWSSGLYQKLIKDEQMKLFRERRVSSSEPVRPLSLYDISGVLFLLISGLIISLVVFIMEVIVYKLKGLH